ncbi:Putative signal transducing protein [Desulfofundulus australicus DSM 11792]|uniref:Putative signal transducing protein n=1 Tax=Desulfofundulus australicus DSM 11792 TaxID=1121425 RepID=A0A1M4ZSG8_9FIRM|nr:DUF2007 domain-containing protein [Desulfofundulus australicus]SHF21013.1 Putative signal transducing protein [Desulfofundulus australicus DSM 11792]
MAWEKLLTAANDLEADMIAGLLKQAGIPTRYKYSGINSYLKVVMGPVVPLEIWVPAEKIREAQEILAAFTGNKSNPRQ